MWWEGGVVCVCVCVCVDVVGMWCGGNVMWCGGDFLWCGVVWMWCGCGGRVCWALGVVWCGGSHDIVISDSNGLHLHVMCMWCGVEWWGCYADVVWWDRMWCGVWGDMNIVGCHARQCDVTCYE